MRFVAGRGAVVAKLLRPGDATERDAAGRGTVVDLLAEAPRRCCWPRRLGGDAGRVHRGGSVGRGAKEVLLAEAPWRRYWQGAPWWICWPGRQGGAAGRGYRGEEDGGTVAGVAASGRNCGG